MKILYLHCDEFQYTLDHPTNFATGEHNEGDAHKYAESLVCFICVEEGDQTKNIVNEAVKHTRKIFRKCKVPCLIVNPFMHLSESKCAPEEALFVSRNFYERCLETLPECEVKYTSFGWFKSFKPSVLGHQYSQMFKSF